MPVSEVTARLFPWMISGFIVMVITGAMLFYAIPVRSYQSIWFRMKMIMLVLAGLNAWVFQVGAHRRAAEWDLDRVPPRGARLAGIFSLVLWAGIIVVGTHDRLQLVRL